MSDLKSGALSPRQAAKAAGAKTYHGSACKKCSGTERYTTTGQCLPCHAARAARLYRNAHPDWNPLHFNRSTAKAAGLTRYHGQPCKRCGATERQTATGGCTACTNTRRKKWRSDNPEAAKAERDAWRKANHEKVREIGKRSRLKHPDRVRQTKARWEEANRERHLEGNRRRYTKWKRAHPEIRAQTHAWRRSHGRAGSRAWLKASDQLAAVDQFIADKPPDLEVDHDYPFAGCLDCGVMGLHVLANLQYLPRAVNRAKRNRCMACFQASGLGDAARDSHRNGAS